MTAPRRASEEQWSEQELVHIFSEILLQAGATTSSPTSLPSPSQILFETIRNANIQPNWPDLALPSGRSMNSCRHIYMQFVRGSSQPALAAPHTYGLSTLDSSSRKRPYPVDALTPTGRTLKPKPATFPPAEPNRVSMSALGSFPLSPLAEPAPSLAALGEPRKKRGRPTKKEQEERRKQMELRTHSLTSPEMNQGTLAVTAITSSSAGQLVQVPMATTPQGPLREESTNSGSSSGKKRRGRPAKVPPSTLEPAPLFSLATTNLAESPMHTPSTRERRGSISTRSETTARTQASLAPESSTSVATASEQPEETKRTPRPRIWE